MSVSDVPPEAAGRLQGGAFSSGLSVPDFAACLHMGMRPVGLVQGFCVMNWSFYGSGSPYRAGAYWSSRPADTISSYRCPHSFGYSSAPEIGLRSGPGPEHRSWGANVEQRWVADAWTTGFSTALGRMVEEAAQAGAHGVIGVVDTTSHLINADVREFHVLGTAVVIEDSKPPADIWTTYLAGQKLGKLIEAGLFPVSVVAAMSSVRVWAICATEILMKGGWDGYLAVRTTDEIRQISDAEIQCRHMARDKIKRALGDGDSLHGAQLTFGGHEIAEGDLERHCTLKGTRVRRFRDAEPLPRPVPVVTLK